jgi:hypothetical protein
MIIINLLCDEKKLKIRYENYEGTWIQESIWWNEILLLFDSIAIIVVIEIMIIGMDIMLL